MNDSTTPKVLTIAGSDSGGGAGIQADLKTFAAHRCYGLSVITALTAQNTLGVMGVEDVSPEMIRGQFEAVVTDIGCDAAKTGMLSGIGTIRMVAECLDRHPLPNLVVDPVMVSKSGHRLLSSDSVQLLRQRILPHAAMVTPNLPEVRELVGFLPASVAEMEQAAQQIAGMTAGAVLIKGGHGEGDLVVDILWETGRIYRFESPRLAVQHTHGTGCTLSAAIACQLALGLSAQEAVAQARAYLLEAMRSAYPVGQGIGPVNHLWPYSQQDIIL